MKIQHRQILTFLVPDHIGTALLVSVNERLASIGSRRVVDCVDQFFLAKMPSADAKPIKQLFRLRQELAGTQCFGDMRTFKKSTTKLRRTEMCQRDLEALLREPNDASLRPAAWKIEDDKPLRPTIQAHFRRTEVATFSDCDLLTVDQDIRSRSLMGDVALGYRCLPDTCLVTMQYTESLPVVFKRLVFDYRLCAQPVSLMAACVQQADASPMSDCPLDNSVEKHVA